MLPYLSAAAVALAVVWREEAEKGAGGRGTRAVAAEVDEEAARSGALPSRTSAASTHCLALLLVRWRRAPSRLVMRPAAPATSGFVKENAGRGIVLLSSWADLFVCGAHSHELKKHANEK